LLKTKTNKALLALGNNRGIATSWQKINTAANNLTTATTNMKQI